MDYRSCILFGLLVMCDPTSANAEFSQRVLGGWVAKEADFPFLVSLRLYGHQFCGGTIIHEQYILTAAHCFPSIIVYPYTGLTVVSGTNSLYYGGQSHRVVKAVQHPLFSVGVYLNNDIGILKLETPMNFTKYQHSIALASKPVGDNTLGITGGWGSTESVTRGWGWIRSVPSTPTLKAVNTMIFNSYICTLYMRSQVYNTQICGFQKPRQGICMGDSGGALVANGELVGVVSTVINNCGSGYPDLFTNVYAYRNFIHHHMHYL